MREIEEEFISLADLQRRIMPDPNRPHDFGDYDIYGKTIPTAVVGGDFYDFIDLESRFGIRGKMGIVIADAAGHGLVAAMLVRDFHTALMTAISFESYYVQDTTPLLFTKINRRMYRSSRPNQFISAFLAELHLDGVIRYMNAGHYSPLVFKKEEVLALEEGGPVLGAFRDTPCEYRVGEAQLDGGDVLVCYTDGIVEAADDAGELYGVDRLRLALRVNLLKSAREIFEVVMTDVERFAGAQGQKDDRTAIVIKKVDRLATDKVTTDKAGQPVAGRHSSFVLPN